jgi:hypothetical protein
MLSGNKTKTSFAQLHSAAISALARERRARCDFHNTNGGMRYELKRAKQKYGYGRTGGDLPGESNGSRINLDLNFCAGVGGKPYYCDKGRDPG